MRDHKKESMSQYKLPDFYGVFEQLGNERSDQDLLILGKYISFELADEDRIRYGYLDSKYYIRVV